MIPRLDLCRERRLQLRRRERGACERCGTRAISGYHSTAYCVPCLMYYRVVNRGRLARMFPTP